MKNKCICFVQMVWLRLWHFQKIKLRMPARIEGKLYLDIDSGARISVDKGIHWRGPLYLKAKQQGIIKIGKYCFFNHNCCITALSKITIGNCCTFANNLVMVDHDHGVAGEFVKDDIVIEDNVWVGANVTILKGVHIGKNAIIAAGSVVNKDVAQGVVVGGIPAKELN